MVLFVDLEDDAEPPEIVTPHWSQLNRGVFRSLPTINREFSNVGDGSRENPNKNAITEALGCYP